MGATIADYARAYVSKYGLCVVRIEPGLKFPRHQGWNQPGGWFGTADDAVKHYADHPDWNIGVVLGPSRLCSLDVDNVIESKQVLGDFGIDIDALAAEYPTIRGNPSRFRIEFAVPEGAVLGRKALSWPNQDDPTKSHVVFELRAGDVQDVFPPSIHPQTGKPYEWITRPNGSFKPLPDALRAVWEHWDVFQPQAMALCPWAPTRKPRLVPPPIHEIPQEGASVIDAFNAAHDIGATLEQYGYQKRGSRWLSPHSSTGLPGVVRLDDKRVYVHHASDPLFKDPPHPVSAFDVFCEYEHHGDVKASVREAAQMLGLAKKREPRLPSPKVEAKREQSIGKIEREVERLAALTDIEYESERTEVAKRFGMKTSVIDKMVRDVQALQAIPEEPAEPPEQSSHYAMWTALGLDMTKNGPLCNLNNAVKCMMSSDLTKNRIWYDEFAKRIYTDLWGSTHEWTDFDTVQLTLAIQRELGLAKMASMQVREALTLVARQNVRNAPKEYFQSLVWDGNDRLPLVLHYAFGATADQFHADVGRCWFVSMVARVMSPGCKVDTVPVFEGKQGLYKSTALEVIGGEWYSECHEQVLSKDFFMILEGKIIVEVAEMHTFSMSDVRRVKGVISCRVDRYRAPYAATVENHPRQAILACTTNEDAWNRDNTGARRFWPIRCGTINLEWLRENRDQLWAEAFARYNRGEHWWDVDKEEAEKRQDERRLGDPFEEKIEKWGREYYEMYRRGFTTIEVLEQCLKLESYQMRHDTVVRVNNALRRLGYEQRMSRYAGQRVRTWWPTRLTDDSSREAPE